MTRDMIDEDEDEDEVVENKYDATPHHIYHAAMRNIHHVCA